MPYVWNVGFYSDDWGILSDFHFAALESQSLQSRLDAFPARPVQALYAALLFKAFGLDPLGYHLINTTVIGAAIASLHLLLVRLRVGRAESFATALFLLVLPQLSTVRVWIAASQIPLSMLLALVSLHAQLSYDRTRRLSWLVTALVAALLSVSAYEIFAPVLAAFALGLVLMRFRTSGTTRFRTLITLMILVALLFAVALVKIAVSGRAGDVADPHRYLMGAYQLIRPDYDWRVHSGLNIFAAIEVHFWRPVAGWAGEVRALFGGRANGSVIASAVAAAAVSYWRLRASPVGADHFDPLRLLLLGCAALLLGHATFLIVPSIMFSPSGMANRVLVAGAVGVAMILVAVLGLLLRATPAKYRAGTFAGIVCVVVFCGVSRVATVAGFWAQAPQLQQRVLLAAQTDLRALPAGTTVILDGVCPYHGPAVVFETSWDIAGALSLALARRVNGDAVSPRMSLAPRGLQTSMYKEPSFYPYGPSLYAYNPHLHLVAPLTSATDARRYFGRRDRWPEACAPSYVGHGELIP
jgi:hypothetical protein